MGLETENKKEIPEGLWIKCEQCQKIIYQKELEKNLKVCPQCGYYYRLTVPERIKLLTEEGSFTENDSCLCSTDPLNFTGQDKKENYKAKLKKAEEKSGAKEAVTCGQAKIGRHPVVLAIMNFDFMGGSMGSVVGEKITRALEMAGQKRRPVIIVSASGGARMQESVFSLMQMAKTSSAVARLNEIRVPFISLLCHPTSGGVTASFAMLGDIHIAEPRAFIGFTGPRVIEQTIKQKLPPGFQTAEFMLEHGLVDLVVERSKLKETLVRLLDLLEGTSQNDLPAGNKRTGRT